MLQAANIDEDLMTGEVVATQGRSHVLDAIKEFADGDLGAKLLEVLCCEGCIMGAGIQQRPAAVQPPPAGAALRLPPHGDARPMALAGGPASGPRTWTCRRTFEPNDQRIPSPAPDELREVMARMGK